MASSQNGESLYFTGEAPCVHQQAVLLKTWNQEYIQVSNGEFHGSVESVNVADVRLFDERMNQRVLQKGATPEDVLAVGIPLRMGGDAILCGKVCGQGDLHVFSSSGEFEYLSPPGFAFIGIEIPLKDDVRRQLDETEFVANKRCRKIRKISVDPRKAATLREAILCLFQLQKREPSILDHNQQLRRTLISSVVGIVQDGDFDADADRLSNPWNLVRRIRDVVVDNPDCPISMTDLAKTLGTSRRSIQYACRSILHTTAVDYLRIIRLNRVRMELAWCPTVTYAATEWGFWHLGNFAKDYRRLFGELPSETHRRARS